MASCKPFIAFILPSMLGLALSQAVIAGTAVKDLGTVGATYPVVEPDLVTELKNEAIRQNKDRDIAKILDLMKTYQPANLDKLPHATDDRTFLVNMDYTVTQDVVDGEGTILYPRGFTFNPLDYLSFPGGLVVIDGTDPLQIKWFQLTSYADNHHVRLLLSDGYAYELSRRLKRSVFYLTTDIAERLQLAAVPSVVVQEDRNLRVHEIKVVREALEDTDDNQ
jgi:conjugal transfer pilus assembly protein TraW